MSMTDCIQSRIWSWGNEKQKVYQSDLHLIEVFLLVVRLFGHLESLVRWVSRCRWLGSCKVKVHSDMKSKMAPRSSINTRPALQFGTECQVGPWHTCRLWVVEPRRSLVVGTLKWQRTVYHGEGGVRVAGRRPAMSITSGLETGWHAGSPL